MLKYDIMKKIIETSRQRRNALDMLPVSSSVDLSNVIGGGICSEKLKICCNPVTGKKTCIGTYSTNCYNFNCYKKFSTYMQDNPFICG